MEQPPPSPPGETPITKKKRNPSFRRMLRDQGIDVPPVVQGVRPPDLPPKRKRNQRRPGKKRAKKRKAEAAAAAESSSTTAAPADLDPAAVSSPAASSSSTACPSPAARPSPPAPTSPPLLPATVALPAAVSPSVAAPSPSPARAPTINKPSSSHKEVTEPGDEQVWDPVDPLGLFDELEGPLDWPSEGLFD
ncbi:uncharacterized protein N7479_001847 [Penicillium vulpinum]|uniref:Uncharacterized protein n=1 Tax=Penicillium vulpinum TaxID=29845 RepID=A0A1V6S5D4_9EURO|nr:uncharacterized protein N7479_001847 [Penicillium vulpinum]KAJ5971929.1 hypothetical protein N7479_001847 [Penicillium vulpinum]OQE08939.1 hypothetical protein PENVUL_c008G04674 [Penicillium vulpinum]